VSITESDDADICVIRTDGTGLMQLTDDPGWEEHPSWSPDGKRIVYDAGSSYPFSNSIWIMNADGSGKTELTDGYHPHWSPDGRHIVFVRYPGGSRGEDVCVMNADRDVIWAAGSSLVRVRAASLAQRPATRGGSGPLMRPALPVLVPASLACCS
jgi:Tol biopolymer transport system component